MRASLFLPCTILLAALTLGSGPSAASPDAARSTPSPGHADGLIDTLRGQTVVDVGGLDAGLVTDVLVDPETAEITHLIVGLNGLDRIVALPLDEAQILPGGTQIRMRSWSRARLEALEPYTIANASGLSSRT